MRLQKHNKTVYQTQTSSNTKENSKNPHTKYNKWRETIKLRKLDSKFSIQAAGEGGGGGYSFIFTNNCERLACFFIADLEFWSSMSEYIVLTACNTCREKWTLTLLCFLFCFVTPAHFQQKFVTKYMKLCCYMYNSY